jgi:hypothetical protein
MKMEKKISVEWRFNAYDDENRTHEFGFITAAELGVLLYDSSYINFNGKMWGVGMLTNIVWDANGIVSAQIPLVECS